MTDDLQTQVTPEATEFGKDQTTEPEAQFGKEDIGKMMKQNLHGQEHIKTLETETDKLRNEVKTLQQDLANASSIDELLEATRQQTDTTLPGATTPQLDKGELIAELKQEMIRELTFAEQQQAEETNWNHTTSKLEAQYGDKYASYVDARTKELGMTNPQMEALAKSSPSAFLELIGVQSKSPAPTTPSASSPPGTNEDAATAEYAKIARLRSENSEDGRAASQMWQDPAWQQQNRARIMAKMKAEGSQFGNTI